MPNSPLALLEKLAGAGLEFVIVGGVALRLWGGSRLTHDIDLVPRLSADGWARAVKAIGKAGGRPRIPEPLEAIADWRNIVRWRKEKNLLAVSFRSPDQSVEIDFLVGEDMDYQGLRARAMPVKLGQYTYYVASIDDLIVLKGKAGRPQDLLDIEELKKIAQRQK